MRPNARRQPKDSFILPPPPTPVEFQHRQFHSRDSDASFASSRPSSVGIGGRPTFDLYKDRSFQQSAVSTINSFLSSHNFPISFKSTVASAKDIHETLKFLLSLIEFPTSKFEDELPLLLKRLSYPFKINKSILKSPAAPHQWPSVLALIHWLVQISKFHLHLSSSPKHHNALYQYTLNSYMNFIRGDDDAVDELDRNIRDKIQHEKAIAEDKLNAAKQNAADLEAELERLRSAPSQKEVLEKEKKVLEDDVKKFHKIIEEFTSRNEQAEKVLAEKEKQLEAKEVEKEKICEENEELKKRVELQTFNARDVERMRRELQAVERDTAEAELARNTWEEKSWDLDTTLSHKIKDLEALALDCNQALKRLKIGNGIQYQLNPKGTTPAEIIGFDHKLILKPALDSFADDIKKSSMEKLEESISYQQKSSENAARLEGKRNQLAAVQSRIDEMEAQMNMIKMETQEYTNRCSAEAQKVLEDVQQADHDLDVMEREAAEVLKTSELKLQETIIQSEEEIQVRARELFQLIDSVSKYKEHVGSKISEMRRDLSETAAAVADAYRGSFPVQFGNP
ncbi:kinetochore protein NDC80 homolog [Abrus precatorius]|uniref:Kinetochore protein NDC80 n=1 Tax=Abrus precatorius TaxID=3816 RepID=A0A8B8K4Y6_ABRPR|nr:kinetochore protein NDC80 homolog [Abrus precatorius]